MFHQVKFFLLVLAALLIQDACSQDEEYGNMLEGDIVLTSEQEASFEATSNPSDPFSPQNAVVRNQRSLWPQGIVPYILDSSLNSQARSAIQAAIDSYAGQSCIRFVSRSTQQDYVRFYQGAGCFSFIGRIGGPQDISIGSGCESEGVVIHEIFHALGRWHEQSRPDRDMFVRIMLGNVQSGRESNFEITNPSFVTTQSIPYDIGSIMHYSARAFSRNGQPTIVPVDQSTSLNQLGQRQGLSSRDLQHVRTLYCSDTPSGSWSSWGSWSGCSRTCNGGIRQRARSCVGGTACEGSNFQNEQCNTQNCPVVSSWGAWTSWSACSASCGGGRQRRIRYCVGGSNCVGVSNQFTNCNDNSCPQPTTWGSWGSWSSCSSTCQGGLRQRRRTCQNGNTCSGVNLQNQYCNTNVPCMPTNPNSGQWSSWGACSLACGKGQRYRVRMCEINNCETEQESCNTQDCQPEPTLKGVQSRGCWYLNTRNARLRNLEGRTADLSDEPFTRTNPVSKCGIAAQRDGLIFFGITIGYCISGSNNLDDYQYVQSRQCLNGRGHYSQGYFIMDVYEITSQQLFMDSAFGANTTTTTAANTTTTTTAAITGDSGMQSGSGRVQPAASLCSVLLLLALTCTTLVGLL